MPERADADGEQGARAERLEHRVAGDRCGGEDAEASWTESMAASASGAGSGAEPSAKLPRRGALDDSRDRSTPVQKRRGATRPRRG
jgi:hypothetical protein